MNKYSYWQHIFLFCHNWFRGRPSPQCSMHCHRVPQCLPCTRVVHMTLLMTGKESSTQVYWVGVYVHVRMCVTFAARMMLMHINVKILTVVLSQPLIQVSFHVHYFASYFDITDFDIHHIAWTIARSIVWVKRFDCENCNIKTNVRSHLLW